MNKTPNDVPSVSSFLVLINMFELRTSVQNTKSSLQNIIEEIIYEFQDIVI